MVYNKIHPSQGFTGYFVSEKQLLGGMYFVLHHEKHVLVWSDVEWSDVEWSDVH